MTIYKSTATIRGIIKATVVAPKKTIATVTLVFPKVVPGVALDVNIITANLTLITS